MKLIEHFPKYFLSIMLVRQDDLKFMVFNKSNRGSRISLLE